MGLSRGSVHFADMDNDGWLDIISSGYGPGRRQSPHLLEQWRRHFSPKTGNTYTDHTIRLVSPCDLNADGWTDIVVTGYSATKGQNAKSFYVYRNKGGRTFEMLDDLFCGFEGSRRGYPLVRRREPRRAAGHLSGRTRRKPRNHNLVFI